MTTATKQVKTCSNCKEEKAIGEFYGDRYSLCKVCDKESAAERMKAYYKTPKGKAMMAYHDSKKMARKYDAEDDLKPIDVMFTFAIANGECTYCGKVSDDYQLEHIVPFAAGGANTFSNISVACASCNRSKNSRSLLEWAEKSGRVDEMAINQTLYKVAQRCGKEFQEILERFAEMAGEKDE